ncbi:MAG: hypothetical protein MK135_02505 [Polyangiaceae bacterium]|nr:hypothetical protein [Polyangiaceae bacterium]
MSIAKNYVLVEVPRVPSVQVAEALCRAMDEALKTSRLRAVLFDTRCTEMPPRDANAYIWEWTRRGVHHDVAAIVVKSELLKVSGNMTAISKGVQLRSFHELNDAELFIRRKLGRSQVS